MSSLFKFFRSSNDAQLEAEFKKVYQEPGVRFMIIAQAVGVLIFLGYYCIDGASGSLPFIGGAQTMRLWISTLLVISIGAMLKYRDAVVRHYTLATNVCFILALEAGCIVSYTAHLHHTAPEALWGFNTTLVSAVVLIFGFSRLTALNTAVIAWVGVLSGVLLALSMPAVSASSTGRLILNLLIVNAAAFSLRNAIESRERQLFILAKENLKKNIYARELEVAKLAAEEADSAKSRFLNNMSHEIRTPMNAVLQILEAVSSEVSPKHQELIERGRKSGTALLTLLNGILNYTKASHGEARVSPGLVDLNKLFCTMAEMHAESLISKGVAMRTRISIDEGSSKVIVDEAKLLDIVGNLISNAAKFTERGFVELAAWVQPSAVSSPQGATLHVVIRDTGVGMSDRDRALAFTPFFQSDGASTRRFGGAGLGLAMVKEWVELLDGSIKVISAVGLGTEAHVTLPVLMTQEGTDEPAVS